MKDWIRLDDLVRRAKDPIGLLATAMTELGAAEGLVIVHGRERGLRRYVEAGGCVRFNRVGEPIIYGELK